MAKLKKIYSNKIISWLFFLFSTGFLFVNFYINRHFMNSLDEYDNLTAAFLMSKGYLFYKDIFNMHFPLPFYWAKMFSFIWVPVESISRSISLYRLSLFPLYFVSFLLVFLSLKNLKSKIGMCLWIVIFSLLVPLYHGNLYLSETFTVVFLSSLFWLYSTIAIGWEKISQYKIFLIVLFCSACVWTQPLLIVVWLSQFFLLKKKNFFLIFLTNTLNFIPIILLIINGQFVDFWKQAVLFNIETYSNFFPEQISNMSMMNQNLYLLPKNLVYSFSHFSTSTQIYQFVLSLSLVMFLISFFVRKVKSKYLIMLILLIVSTRIREIKIVPGQIFNFAFFPFLSVGLSSLIIFYINSKKIINKMVVFVFMAISFFTILSDYKPILKNSWSGDYNYEVFWGWRQRIGEDIMRLTMENEKILVYPYDSDLYYLSNRFPADKFLYWYPWMNASEDLKNEKTRLINNKPSFIYYGNVSYKDNPTTYANFFPNMLDSYDQVKKDGSLTNYWIRSDLKGRVDLPFELVEN